MTFCLFFFREKEDLGRRQTNSETKFNSGGRYRPRKITKSPIPSSRETTPLTDTDELLSSLSRCSIFERRTELRASVIAALQLDFSTYTLKDTRLMSLFQLTVINIYPNTATALPPPFSSTHSCVATLLPFKSKPF